VCDVVTDAGVAAVGLPASYPRDAAGASVPHATTQAIGADVHDDGLRGVWCRSAAGVGRELAWFPSDRSAARPVWRSTRPYGAWRNAVDLADLTDPLPRNIAESGR
jgi:hypothetical protein